MAKTILTPRQLTADAFGPFGDVIEVSGAPIMINEGNTERYDNLSRVSHLGDGSENVISLFRAKPRILPMRIRMMERHPYGSQSFHPLSGENYLVLVGESAEELLPEHLHLFLATKDQGINYHPNTWHHPVLGLNKECDFLVVDRKGTEHNCEEFYFPKDMEIEIHV